jgi:uncharacterized membrane protein required for colicin V production
MTPIIIDLLFLGLAILLCIQGWRQGFVKMGGSLVALAVSVSLATWGVAWIERVTGWHFSGNPAAFVIVFLLVTLVLTKLMGFLVTVLDLARKILSILPGISMLNSILGFVVGGLQAGMVALAIAFATVNFFPQSEIRNALVQSYSVSNAINVLVKMNVL